MKKKMKGQDTRAIELFVEQPKHSQESRFLRAVTSTRAPDACVKKAQSGGASASIEMTPEDGGGGLFGSRALQLYFARHSRTRQAQGRRKGNASHDRGAGAKAQAEAVRNGGVRGGVEKKSGATKGASGLKPGIRKKARPHGAVVSREGQARPAGQGDSAPGVKSVAKKKPKKVSSEL
jgi:hypothetical protein